MTNECPDCSARVCNICKNCHTMHCDAEQLCKLIPKKYGKGYGYLLND